MAPDVDRPTQRRQELQEVRVDAVGRQLKEEQGVSPGFESWSVKEDICFSGKKLSLLEEQFYCFLCQIQVRPTSKYFRIAQVGWGRGMKNWDHLVFVYYYLTKGAAP